MVQLYEGKQHIWQFVLLPLTSVCKFSYLQQTLKLHGSHSEAIFRNESKYHSMPTAEATARASLGNVPGGSITEINTHRIEQCFTTKECKGLQPHVISSAIRNARAASALLTGLVVKNEQRGFLEFKVTDVINTGVCHVAYCIFL